MRTSKFALAMHFWHYWNDNYSLVCVR